MSYFHRSVTSQLSQVSKLPKLEVTDLLKYDINLWPFIVPRVNL